MTLSDSATPSVTTLAGASSPSAALARRETIVHRLRTPLHTILGYVGLLKFDASDEMLEQLCIIENSATELLTSIEDLPDSVKTMPFQARAANGVKPAAALSDGAMPSRLPDEEIQSLCDLLQLGRLLDVQQWAADLGERLPQHAESARKIKTLARSANLTALVELLARWAEQPAHS